MEDDGYRPIPAPAPGVTPAEAEAVLSRFAARMLSRRTIRHYSDEPVPRSLIEAAIEVANSAPSGANVQPWRFVVVTDPDIKKQIRQRAEDEERGFYEGRASKEWLEALAPLGTDWHKEHLEVAPYLIVVFEVHAGLDSPKGYYVKESVGIAVGFLLAALHHAGLATLTHTPSPMGFLREILGRPKEERPYLIVTAGCQAPDAQVPDITKNPPEDVTTWL